MPISKINPDGSVDIYNTKTGEVRTGVKPEDLASISPKLVGLYQQKLAEQEAAQIEAQSIQRGIIQPSATTSVETQKILQQGGYQAPKTEEQIKEEAGKSLRKDAVTSINRILEKRTKGMTGTVQWGAKVPALATETKATLAEYEKLKSLLSLENIKYLKGTGQISDREGMILEKAALAIPENRKISDDEFREVLTRTAEELSRDFTEEDIAELLERKNLGTPEEAIKKKGDAYDFLYSGGKRESLSGALGDITSGEEVRDVKLKDTLVDMVIGTTADMWKDISNAIVLRGKTGKELDETLTNVMDMSQRALERAEQEPDPEMRARLQKVAMEGMNEISRQRREIDKLWSESKDVPYALRALGVAGETAAIAAPILGLKDLGKKAIEKVGEKGVQKAGRETVETIAQETGKGLTKKPSLVARTGQKIKELNPVRILSEKQTAEAAKVTQKVDVDALDNVAKNIAKKSSADMAAYKNLAPSIKETKNATKLLENLRYWGEQSFTTSGATKDKAAARIASALYHNGIEQLKTIAPEAYKYRQLLNYTFKLPKTTGKWLWRLFLGKGLFGGFGS